MEELSHLDKEGNVKMVDVTNKISNNRIAKAEGKITMLPETILAIQSSSLPKGNVLTTAKIAGIQAAKKTSDLIPMCHQLNLSNIDIIFKIESNDITICSEVKVKESTGVEMEALTAVSITALTIYDMCKAIDKTMSIDEESKTIGGDLGWFSAEDMVESFSIAVKKLVVKEITDDPVQSQFGWHIIKLNQVRKKAIPPLSEKEEEIKLILQKEKLKSHLDELRLIADIKR